MPLLQERVIAAFFLSLFLVFYGGKAMKIYVKESKSLSIQTVSLMFYDSVTIVPLLSLDDVLYSDLIIVSQSDVSSMTGLEEYPKCIILCFMTLIIVLFCRPRMNIICREI